MEKQKGMNPEKIWKMVIKTIKAITALITAVAILIYVCKM